MKEASVWVLKALLNQSSPGKRETLERYLSPIEQEKLKRAPAANLTENKEEEPLLSRIHWSWFLPLLKLYEPNDQLYFLSALPTHEQENLNRELGLSIPSDMTMSEMGKQFFQQTLIDCGNMQHIKKVLIIKIEKDSFCDPLGKHYLYPHSVGG